MVDDVVVVVVIVVVAAAVDHYLNLAGFVRFVTIKLQLEDFPL